MSLPAASISAPIARPASRAVSSTGLAVAVLLVFSVLKDIALLTTWNTVNHGFYDSDWLNLYQAVTRLRAGGPAYVGAGVYLHPPTFLLLAPLTLPGYIPSRIIWSLASAVMLLLTGRLTIRALDWRPDTRTEIIGALFILVYGPTILLIPTAANSTALVVLSYGLGIRQLRRGRDGWGGAALCLGMLVKPQLAFLTLPLLLYKRRWRAAGAYLATGVAAVLLALLVTGRQTYVEFFKITRVTADMANRVPLWIRDIPGLHAALLQAFPGSALAGAAAYVLGAALMAALAWYWRGPWEPASPRFLAGWAMLLLVDLLAAPYAHSDDLVLLIIPMIVLYVLWDRARHTPVPWRGALIPALLALKLSPTMVVYFREHFMVPAMLAALLVLWRATPRQAPAATQPIGHGL